jgi:hypothetical protein
MSDATNRHEVKVRASAETQPLEFSVVAAKAEVSASRAVARAGCVSWVGGGRDSVA